MSTDKALVRTPLDAATAVPGATSLQAGRLLDLLADGKVDSISEAGRVALAEHRSSHRVAAERRIRVVGGRTGGVTISTRMPVDRRLTDAGGQAVATVEILIDDSGPGIPAEVLAKLATPFFTTKTDGTGLGLAVSRHWIARHGGTLDITSTTGEGARVRVALPLGGSKGREGSTLDMKARR